jgi:hypothetical protein
LLLGALAHVRLAAKTSAFSKRHAAKTTVFSKSFLLLFFKKEALA